MNFDLMDIREGYYSIIDETPRSIIIRLAPTHTRGSILGIAVKSILAYIFINTAYLQRESIASMALCTLIGAICFYGAVRSWLDYKTRYNKIVLEIRESRVSGDTCDDNIISSNDIAAVLARENVERDICDDPLWQIYIVLADRDRPILIHQNLRRYREREIEYANKLASRWNVPLHIGNEPNAIKTTHNPVPHNDLQ